MALLVGAGVGVGVRVTGVSAVMCIDGERAWGGGGAHGAAPGGLTGCHGLA